MSEVKSIVGRNSGRFIFVEADIAVRTTDLKKAHLLSEEIERTIKKEIPNIDRVLIHYEPETKTHVRYALPLNDREGRLADDFGEAPYFSIIDIDIKRGTVLRQELIDNNYRDLEKGRGIKAAEFLLKYKPDIVVTRKSLAGKGPGYTFTDSGTETILAEAESLEEFLNYRLKSVSP